MRVSRLNTRRQRRDLRRACRARDDAVHCIMGRVDQLGIPERFAFVYGVPACRNERAPRRIPSRTDSRQAITHDNSRNLHSPNPT